MIIDYLFYTWIFGLFVIFPLAAGYFGRDNTDNQTVFMACLLVWPILIILIPVLILFGVGHLLSRLKKK